MSTTATTTDVTRPAEAASAATTTTTTSAGSRRWAWAGVAAGVVGVVGIAASMQIDAVYAASDAEAVVDRLATQVPAILVFHTATMLGVVLLVVFAAGLRRRLADQLPSRSLLPDVAAAGLGLVAVAGLLGSGLTTEFVFGVSDPEAGLVPEAAVVFGNWVGTIPWLWVGAGLAGVCVAVRGAAPRRHLALARLGRGDPRGAHPAARHLAAAVHGRHDGPGLAARHGAGSGSRGPRLADSGLNPGARTWSGAIVPTP